MEYRTEVSLISWDGTTEFILAGPGEGNHGVHLASGVDGIYDLPLSVLVTEHAFQRGGSYGGTRYPPRRFAFGVVIYGEGGFGWDRRNSRWRKAWSSEHDSTLVIKTPTSRRFMRVRLSETPQLKTDTDPNQSQVERYVMSVIALDPFWYGDERVIDWENPTDTTGITVPENVTLSPITLDNPGDFYSWPLYELWAAPGARWILPDYSWGNNRWRAAEAHAARHIVLPAMAEGEHLRVDTDEMAKLGQFKSATDTQFYKRMKMQRFLYPLQPGLVPDAPNAFIGVANAPAGLRARITLLRPWTAPWGMEVDD